MTDKLNVGVIGLGSMGYGMARSLLVDGHQVYGFDLNADRVKQFETEGGTPGDLEAVAHSLEAVVVLVVNDRQTEQVLFGKNSGLVAKMKPDSLVMVCATVPPDFARAMEARCQEARVHYLDSPISGGSLKASEGRLTIMASGTQIAFDRAEPILSATSERVFRLGSEAGAGSAMKAVNQLLAGVHIATMAEAITFAMTQGIQPDSFLDVISQCAGTSWMLENRAPHIVDGDYSPHSTVNIWPKDLGIVLDIARKQNFSAPITAAALQQFLAAAGMGLGDEDDAAVAKVYARNNRLTLPGEE